MKAVRLVKPGQPLEMQEVPVPTVGARDVLVKVKAAGICRSDVHYRAGVSPVHPLPMTLGHEVAGVIEEVGTEVRNVKVGERVCLHYLVTCGDCRYCARGSEQFCASGSMIGKYQDGGYAEYIAVPSRNAIPLPDDIPFERGAIMMCSSATSFHALNKAELKTGESVAVFGVGGLGISAVQLAQAFGALDVYAVDINADKLNLAESYGAIAVNAKEADPVAEISRLTGGQGVDVALELVGLPQTVEQAVHSLGVFGRAVLVGLTDQPFELNSYRDVILKEAQIIGCSDHLLQELPLLVKLVRRGALDLSSVITRTVSLDAEAINAALDDLESFGPEVRTVITP
ncbi:MAG: alcohol dehydrogenase catalytic domain-containing protein [Anaerolineae bacterium]